MHIHINSTLLFNSRFRKISLMYLADGGCGAAAAARWRRWRGGGGGAVAAGMRFGGGAHMKQGNRLEDLSLPTLICPPSCDCATAAYVRVCSQAMGLEWTRNSLL